jgi:hypothetical protein
MGCRVKPGNDESVTRPQPAGWVSPTNPRKARLRRIYGRGRWRKRKGIGRVRLSDGSIHVAELHRFEAAGIGRKEFKIKHLL